MSALPAPATARVRWQYQRRALQGVALVLAVSLLHGLLLLPRAPSAEMPAAVLSRGPPLQLVAPPRAPMAESTVASALLPTAVVAPKPTQPRRAARAVNAAQPPAPMLAPRSAPSEDAAPAPAEAQYAVPVYATRLPQPALLHFEVQRGALVGSGRLLWQRRDPTYELSLDAELQGKEVLGSTSRGVLDADGVAPVRLAERRRAREVRAANFQRDAQIITFSGPQLEYPLHPGAQDRLSWMIQLPAIVAAEPALARPGARITLFVVGTRGDAEAWHFEALGDETLTLPCGTVAQALHLQRDAQRPYDTRVEVWLDPARQHLPVRVRFTTVPDGTPTELRLSQMLPAPG